MRQQRPSLFLLSLIGFCGLVLPSPPALIGAEETPIPPVTPAATGASEISPTPEPPSVRSVGVRNWKGEQRKAKVTYAQRGDQIWVDIINFKDWVKSLEEKHKKPENSEVKNLILYLDHIALPGVSPFYWHEWSQTKWTGKVASGEYTVTTVGFSLLRNDTSKPGWSHLLNQPVLNRRVIVSVGFDNGEEIPSELKPDKNTKKLEELQEERRSIPLSDKDKLAENDQQQDEERARLLDQQFYLTIIPTFRTAFGLIVILGALIAFLALARHTHIIRDASAPRRPDGRRPYSLARGQMAFWFFLVIASYFFLWIVTGDMDTLNTSVLGLIGISAGTALGSAFIDARKPISTGSSGNQPIVDVTRPHLEVLAELNQLRADTQKELEALQKARASISPSDKNALDENERQQNEVRERLANYRWQSAYFAWPTWKGVMYDLLAENNLISFHRFQIFVWTLILGIMFVANVYNELAMPQFSATLLGLLGISAGTYVGFKIPETKAQ